MKGFAEHLPPVATVLEPSERRSVDAAGAGLYRTLHRDSLDEVRQDLKERRISAVVVSVARCVREESAHVRAVVRDFPRIPTVALVSAAADTNPEAVLALGNCGVRNLVDVRYATGWGRLRDLLGAEVTKDMDRIALATLQSDLQGVSPDCWRFFETLFSTANRAPTVRVLARQLEVLPSTLMSRFFRARLPSPKQYLAYARLVRAARLFENPGLSVADVANHLNYSSPQSFGRHIRMLMGICAGEFRTRFDGATMLQRFREELVIPFLPILRVARPLALAMPVIGPVSEQRPTVSADSGAGAPSTGPSIASLLFAPKRPRLLQ